MTLLRLYHSGSVPFSLLVWPVARCKHGFMAPRLQGEYMGCRVGNAISTPPSYGRFVAHDGAGFSSAIDSVNR